MKRMKSKRLNSALIAGALTASIAFGGVGAYLTSHRVDVSPAYAFESNYTIQPTVKEDAKTYYVSPTAVGLDHAGTEADPVNVWLLLTSQTSPLKAGDTVMVLPGRYEFTERFLIPMTITGEYNNYITVKNASTTGEKAIFDFYKSNLSGKGFHSQNRGVQIDSDFWHWYGIDICGAGDNGMYIGGSYNVIENCEFYDNRDTGLQIGRSASELSNINDWPSYNLIKNCTSHNNYDNETYGENADGFAAKLTVGHGNIFDGCIAYRNSDDGWDLFAKTDSGNIGAVIMYNCVAFENGYLEEPQQEFHAKFGNLYDTSFNEDNTNSFLTRDGDGNGFKLGGSIMEGDVYMYNCLSFNNRMHGVTDNSNPGVLTIENITSYNNSSGIDNNPESPTFGQVTLSNTGIAADGNSGNINFARQTYSYNTMSNVLSVNKDLETVAADEYRGAAEYCIFDMANKKDAYKVEECVDVSNRTEKYATKGDKIKALKAEEVFEQIPIEWTTPTKDEPTRAYTYHLTGLKNTTVHTDYRNADGSVNMHDILKIKDYSKLLGDSHKIGSDLTKTTWEEYEHFSYFNASNATSAAEAAVKSAEATLTLNTKVEATFQDFDLLTGMEDVTITWTTSDDSLIKINTDTPVSASGTQDARAIVYRASADKQVTLTATIKHKEENVSATKTFNVTVKKDIPTIGDAIFDGVDGGNIIHNQFDDAQEPTMTVRNAADYNGKLLDEKAYKVESKVMYAPDKNARKVQIHHFTTAVPGVYDISKIITLGSQKEEMSYTIYVASNSANVEFVKEPLINVNQYGYTISGEVSSPTGTLYALSSASQIKGITANQIKSEGKGYEFRGETINFQFENSNSSAYYIYYVLCNMQGEATSEIVEVPVATKDINTVADFKAMVTDNNSSTIYMLKADIDLAGEDWSAITSQKKSFTGVLNGLGHTVKNLTVKGAEDQAAALFYRLKGGTVMNIKFDNFDIKNSANKVGIFATTEGGYIYNVQMTNVRASGAQRIGALIGQVMEGELHVDQVSLINDVRYEKPAEAPTATTFDLDIYYTKSGSTYTKATSFVEGTEYYVVAMDINGVRTGGIVGDIQASKANLSAQTYISNCYISAIIGPSYEQFKGSIVGRNDDRNAADYLEIKDCVSNSILYGRTYVGGIIGSSQNTGAGVTRISNCVFIGDMYYGSLIEPLTASLKNCSGIVGRYSSNGDCIVANCYAKFEDNNANHEVTGEIVYFGEVAKPDFWTKKVGLSAERWQFHMEGDKAAAPYATVIFIPVE